MKCEHCAKREAHITLCLDCARMGILDEPMLVAMDHEVARTEALQAVESFLDEEELSKHSSLEKLRKLLQEPCSCTFCKGFYRREDG